MSYEQIIVLAGIWAAIGVLLILFLDVLAHKQIFTTQECVTMWLLWVAIVPVAMLASIPYYWKKLSKSQ